MGSDTGEPLGVSTPDGTDVTDMWLGFYLPRSMTDNIASRYDDGIWESPAAMLAECAGSWSSDDIDSGSWVRINYEYQEGFSQIDIAEAVVPEPATVALLGLGTLALFQRRRSRA